MDSLITPLEKAKSIWLAFTRFINRVPLNQQLVLAGLIVGIVSGFAAFVLEWSITLIWSLGQGRTGGLSPLWRGIATVGLPALGGLFAGILVHRYYPDAKGHGVDEVINAIRDNRGKIAGRVAWVKTLSSAATIGTGGSAGREGPIVQIGAAVGSWMGQTLGVNHAALRTLAAAGAAGGLAASFSIPLAGVFFTMEVILRNWASRAFPAVVIAAVTGTVTARLLLGNEAFFTPLSYEWQRPIDFLYYSLLGLICAPLGLWYRQSLALSDRFFASLRSLPDWLKPALGGLAVGMLGLMMPSVLGSGHDIINGVLTGETLGWWMVVLVFGKILATSLTLGSGGSGGMMMPALFVGAMAGGCWGMLLQYLPGTPAQTGAFAVVGMACLFTAAFRAPVSAMVMAFETTRDYGVLPPVMVACAITFVFSRRSSKID